MGKKTFRKAALWGLTVACAATATVGAVALGGGASADGGVTLVYGARAFSVTEDYNYLTDYAYANEATLTDAEKTMTGTLMKAKRTGTAAEGATFSVKETQTSDFSMDFRVFSRSSYQSGAYGTSTHWSDWAGIQSDDYNPYQDLKAVDFTFTSVSDPTQSFTLHLRGSYAYFAHQVGAYVSVNGVSTIGTDIYGVKGIPQTSFSNKYWNWGAEYTTDYNSLNFDLASGEISVNGVSVYTLATSDLENYSDDGYTVSVQYADVTANDVTGNELALAFATAETTGDSYYGPLSETFTDLSADIPQGTYDLRYSATTVNGHTFHEQFTGYSAWSEMYIGNIGYKEGVGEAYEREAQMLVYSVNGQTTVGLESVTGSTLVYNGNEFTSTQDYTYADYQYANENTLTSAETGLTGALMKAKRTGEAAEGLGFSVKETQTDDFSMDFRVFSQTSYKHNGIGWETHWGNWAAVNSDDYNP
ncbi:MAG: hypothetical protein IJ514_05010, partial [Clostridia bacterium]|nr:hypothetical protein [Clostridia bacterium]